MEIDFLPPAKSELTEAISYYNAQSEGLGYKFAVEVKRTLERIVQYPDAWSKLSNRTRRCRTNRFNLSGQERYSAHRGSDEFKQRTGNMEITA